MKLKEDCFHVEVDDGLGGSIINHSDFKGWRVDRGCNNTIVLNFSRQCPESGFMGEISITLPEWLAVEISEEIFDRIITAYSRRINGVSA